MKSRQKGFTLIELLVVIAIIGILSAVVIASTSKARARGRDGQRMSDIRQINNAIQLYILANGRAPYINKCGIPNDITCPAGDWEAGDWENDLGVKLLPYIKKLPKDPCGTGCDDISSGEYYHYMYGSPGANRSIPSSYNIWASNLESTLQPFGVSTTESGGFTSE